MQKRDAPFEAMWQRGKCQRNIWFRSFAPPGSGELRYIRNAKALSATTSKVWNVLKYNADSPQRSSWSQQNNWKAEIANWTIRLRVSMRDKRLMSSTTHIAYREHSTQAALFDIKLRWHSWVLLTWCHWSFARSEGRKSAHWSVRSNSERQEIIRFIFLPDMFMMCREQKNM